jgi:hypothetical protein
LALKQRSVGRRVPRSGLRVRKSDVSRDRVDFSCRRRGGTRRDFSSVHPMLLQGHEKIRASSWEILPAVVNDTQAVPDSRELVPPVIAIAPDLVLRETVFETLSSASPRLVGTAMRNRSPPFTRELAFVGKKRLPRGLLGGSGFALAAYSLVHSGGCSFQSGAHFDSVGLDSEQFQNGCD